MLIFFLLFILWIETSNLMGAHEDYSFSVDKGVSEVFQVNMDITVAAPCSDLTVFIVDASGDQLFVSNLLESRPLTRDDEASPIMVGSGWMSHYGPHEFQDGEEWCRMAGIFETNRVRGRLVISQAMNGRFFRPAKLNLTHSINELSFGPYYPSQDNPLDESVMVAAQLDSFFVYNLNIVPTTFKALGMEAEKNQYSYTETSRNDKRNLIPGIYFEYDIEPITVTITDARVSFLQWLFRVANIVGGVNFAMIWLRTRRKPAQPLEDINLDDDPELPYRS